MSGPEWKVDVPMKVAKKLAESLRQGPIFNDQGRRYLTEIKVAQLDGIKIEIFANEHPPPHFRVKYAGEAANYTISDCTQLDGDLKKWYRNIKRWHQDNKDFLIERWNKTRPSDCPVGEYREET